MQEIILSFLNDCGNCLFKHIPRDSVSCTLLYSTHCGNNINSSPVLVTHNVSYKYSKSTSINTLDGIVYDNRTENKLMCIDS